MVRFPRWHSRNAKFLAFRECQELGVPGMPSFWHSGNAKKEAHITSVVVSLPVKIIVLSQFDTADSKSAVEITVVSIYPEIQAIASGPVKRPIGADEPKSLLRLRLLHRLVGSMLQPLNSIELSPSQPIKSHRSMLFYAFPGLISPR